MTKKIIVTEKDYALISRFISYHPQNLSTYSYLRLLEELKEANIIAGDQLPPGVIGLGSEVRLFEKTLGKQLHITLVLPAKVDPQQHKISIFSPLGVALIGYREGDKVAWEVHGTIRQYKVLQVTNPDKNP